MKKEYVKPFLAVESFQLDAAIAASCSQLNRVTLGYTENTCTLVEEMPDLGYFGAACAKEPSGVDVTLNPGSDVNDGFCYHGPIMDLTTMFMVS